jgi:hypothetical protein
MGKPIKCPFCEICARTNSGLLRHIKKIHIKDYNLRNTTFLEEIFKILDEWRNYPGYQIERRVDMILGKYLPLILEKTCGLNGVKISAPEFPVKIDKKENEKKTKTQNHVDFLCHDSSCNLYFVEIKTDNESIDKDQIELMNTIQGKDFNIIIDDIKGSLKNTHLPRIKYYHLFRALKRAKLLSMPDKLSEILESNDHKGYRKYIEEIKSDIVKKANVIYILPYYNEKTKKDYPGLSNFKVITFEDICKIQMQGDENLKIVKKYLKKWREPIGYINHAPHHPPRHTPDRRLLRGA